MKQPKAHHLAELCRPPPGTPVCEYGHYVPEDEREATCIAIWREAQAEQQLRIAREARTC